MANYHLVYAEDIQPGMWLEAEKAAPDSGPVRYGLGGIVRPPRKAWALVLECRTFGNAVSIILVDDDGEQQPMIVPDYSLIKILNDPPLPAELAPADFATKEPEQ